MSDRAAHLVKLAAIKNRANRLRVFAAIKDWMLTYRECPTGMDIVRTTGLSLTAVLRHMRDLVGATGLPLPLTIGHAGRPYRGQGHRDDDKPVPVDEYEPIWVEVAE